MTQPPPAPIIFPHIADAGGYTTQFFLIGTGADSSLKLSFYGEDGKPLAVGNGGATFYK